VVTLKKFQPSWPGLSRHDNKKELQGAQGTALTPACPDADGRRLHLAGDDRRLADGAAAADGFLAASGLRQDHLEDGHPEDGRRPADDDAAGVADEFPAASDAADGFPAGDDAAAAVQQQAGEPLADAPPADDRSAGADDDADPAR
jgi:hypothetical protein